MEILGICLTVISLIGAYLWKANGKLQKAVMDALRGIGEGQNAMMQALERIEEGQKKGFAILEEGQKEIAQMLLNQTRILERIEGKIPSPS
jgi:cellobiose-specific phosphotransferase system component IIA